MKWIIPAAACLCSGCGGFLEYPLWFANDAAVADVDGDGRRDVVTLAEFAASESRREGRLVVHRQTSPGAFAPAETYVVGTAPWRLAVGDVDGDGLPDLVVTDWKADAVWLMLNDPLDKGRFLPAQKIASASRAGDAVIADLNGDGAPDVAITDTGRVVLLQQDAARRGTFLPPVDVTLPGSPGGLAAGDLDRDGRTDLVTWVYLASSGFSPNGEIAIGLQQSNGTIGPIATLAPEAGLNVNRVAIADYDGDGKGDLFVFLTPFDDFRKVKLSVLLQGVQPGTFGPPVDTSLVDVEGRDGVAFADLNGDGRPDVALVGFSSSDESRLNVLIQSGAGSFALTSSYDLPIAASQVAAGDLDGDGLNDLVVYGGNKNECLVLTQSRLLPGTFNVRYALR